MSGKISGGPCQSIRRDGFTIHHSPLDDMSHPPSHQSRRMAGGLLRFVERALAEGPDIEGGTQGLTTPLLCSPAKGGLIKFVKFLLRRGAKLHAAIPRATYQARCASTAPSLGRQPERRELGRLDSTSPMPGVNKRHGFGYHPSRGWCRPLAR